MSSTGAAAAGVTEREQAVAEGYREYGPALFTYVCRLLGGDRHHAEDLVQETLLRCWSKYRAGDSKKLRPWLFVVAHNLVMDFHRGRTARPQEVNGAWLDHVDAVERDQIDQMLSSVVIADAVKSLSATHREVLYYTYILGKTISEAASCLGIPAGTVKSRVHYALRSLKLALEERDALPRRA